MERSMSRRTRTQQGAAMSRRTGHREQQQQQAPAVAALAGTHRFVSNPIFFREDSSARLEPVVDMRLRRGPYGHGSAAAAAAAAGGVGKQAALLLPLPPSRTLVLLDSTASRFGGDGGGRPALVSVSGARGGGSGWALRRVTHVDDDPFLAAYVACTKSGGGGGGGKKDDAPAKQQQRRKLQKRKKKGQTETFQGCGIWNGLAAPGAKYAGAMSCRYGSAVAVAAQHGRAPVASSDSDAPRGPTLDLSRPLVVCSRRWRDPSLGNDEHRAR